MRQVFFAMLSCAGLALSPGSAHGQAAPGAGPSWVVRPSGETFELFYPVEAVAQGVAGRVDLRCRPRPDQRADCVAMAEVPEGWGFGEAALAISRSFRMAPARNGGEPFYYVRLPFRPMQSSADHTFGQTPNFPIWEDAPSPRAVGETWARSGISVPRARGTLGCLVKADRTLECHVLRESVAGAGAVALELSREFTIDASEADFSARHRVDPFVLPMNFGFHNSLEPVNLVSAGLSPLELTLPPEASAPVYPEEARTAAVSGSVTLLCTAGAEPSATCEITTETPPGHGFGQAAQRMFLALIAAVGETSSPWPFLEGDQLRIVVPFEATN